jgi:hypothetical protein
MISREHRGAVPVLKYLTVTVLSVCLALAVGPLYAARIIVIGDSWGVAAGPALQQVLADNGSTDSVVSIAEGGREAAELNSPEWFQQITATLQDNPDAEFVHLSLGGNDFLGNWFSFLSQEQEDQLIADILEDIGAIVDHILAQRPDIRIFWSSYDFPRPLIIGEPADVNNASLRFSAQAKALANARGSALTYGDFNGLTQVVYGFDGVQLSPYDPGFPIPPGDPSLPDPQYPGPAVAYADAIHLTPDAFLMLAENQYEVFYQAALNFRINAGLNDAWYNPDTDGQGFLITVFEDAGKIFVAWFTFDVERPPEDVTAILGDPGHRWLTAQGDFSGDTATLPVVLASGGVFDSPEPAVERDEDYGTMTITWHSCNSATLTYDIPSAGQGVIELQRVAPDNVPLCESLAQ